MERIPAEIANPLFEHSPKCEPKQTSQDPQNIKKMTTANDEWVERNGVDGVE